MSTNRSGPTWVYKSIVLLCLVVATGGCSNLQTRPTITLDNIASEITAGDTILLVHNDGSSIEFQVTEVTDDGVVGDGVFVAYSDTASVEIVKSADKPWRRVNPSIEASIAAVMVGVIIGIAIM